jgi:hypothetical protein
VALCRSFVRGSSGREPSGAVARFDDIVSSISSEMHDLGRDDFSVFKDQLNSGSAA